MRLNFIAASRAAFFPAVSHLRGHANRRNYAMTRQTLTFDSFFNENILDQGTGYRYDMGVSQT